MGLYQQLNKIEDKYQIKKYEQLLKSIDNSYIICKTFNTKRDNLDLVIRYCLDKGTEGLKYYFSSYYKKGQFDIEYPGLENKLNSFVEKQNQLQKRIFGVIDQTVEVIEKNVKAKYGNEKYQELLSLKMDNQKRHNSIEVTYNYLEAINEKFPELLENDLIKADIFLATLSLNPDFQKDFIKIKNEIDNKRKLGISITKIISEHIANGDIKVDVKDTLKVLKKTVNEHLDEEDKLNKELTEKLPNVYVKNDFLIESERLKNKVQLLLAQGIDKEEALKSVLPEAYGLVKAAILAKQGITPYDVQLMGAIALNEGKITEMYTGEGKTITAIFPAFLNALTGDEVDIFTPNDYLSKRDAEKNKAVFELLGLSVGCTLEHGQTEEEKQAEYKKDIVYGSTAAFAFDFLNDVNQKDKTKIMQREKRPGFAIIDEADQILINNALTPYLVEQSDNKSLTPEEQEDNKEVLLLLQRASIFARKLGEITYETSSRTEYETITGDRELELGTGTKYETISEEEKTKKLVTREEKEKRVSNAYLIIPESKTNGSGRVYITKKGMNKLFSLAMREEIEELSSKTRTFFEENPSYVEGEDYQIENGKFSITEKGLDRASEQTDEFFELKLKFLSDEKYTVLRKYVSNALTVEYLMEKGKDYDLIVNKETEKQEVVVLQTSRAAYDSEFTDGIHEAISIKEGISIIPRKNERLLKKDAPSMSTRALISRYEKRSGMTGTADQSAFYDIYGMDTFTVPRNKQYMYETDPEHHDKPEFRKDLPDRLYKTKEEKLQGILEDIIESHEKGQPVLVVVDNADEAAKLHELIIKKGLSANLLTAVDKKKKDDPMSDVDDEIEKENILISEAGKLGAITIATEMAGRGTDIKLGGEQALDRDRIKYEVLVQESLSRIISESLITKKNVSLDEKNKFILSEKIRLLRENRELAVSVAKLMKKCETDPNYNRIINERIAKKQKEITDKVKETGGLKYIQMSPFITRRNDNQGKGRVGRQGEIGTTRIYASIEELPNLGVDRHEIRELRKMMAGRKVLEDHDVDGRVSEIIETAQSENEFNMDLTIASTDTIDLAMSSKGMLIFNSKKRLAKTEDVTPAVNNMITEVIADVIKDNVNPKKKKKVDKDNSRLSRLGLNTSKLVEDIESTFGITIDEEKIFTECTDVDDLKDLIQQTLNQPSKDKERSSTNKRILGEYLDEIYVTFMDGIEDVQLQMFNDMVAQNLSPNRYKDIEDLYSTCMKNSRRNAVQKMFGVKKKEKEPEQTPIPVEVEEIRKLDKKNRISIFETMALESDVVLTRKNIVEQDTNQKAAKK